ncbi:MAG: ATP-dependent DNA helicase DinG, partial [Comamonadaceae bacterium]|nr:ATP-dependent DNA helicase DinG [Comamonadaceae bacterium]
MSDHPSTPSGSSGPAAPTVEGPLAREALALAAFDHVVSRASGFRPREGQRQMAAFIASTLSGVRLGDESVSGDAALPDRGIAVVQAGTGVGKSAAYAATVIPLALAQGRRVVISTATVALQEQLIHKDLPALAALLPQPFAYALAKGRGRYVCRLKLDQLGGGDPAHADLFGTEEGLSQATADTWQERGRQYLQWSQALDQGDWDGDRDRLDDPPDPGLWGPVAAERHTCTARHCPAYNSCSYYQARQRLAQAQVIVVNHDLLLSTLGLHALPAPQDCYLVLDEAHHLGSIAQGQFTAQVDLMRTSWLDRLPRAFDEVASAISHHPADDVAVRARDLKAAMGELARLAMVRVGGMPGWGERRPDAPPTVDRFEGGVLPAGWDEVVGTIAAHATALLKVAESLATQLKAMAREEPSEAARCAQLYSRIGGFAPRLQHAQETADLWLQTAADGQPPLAKWLEAGVQHGLVTLTAHACPLQPGHLLRSHLWRHVRGAVVTSASLTTCGGFEHFLHESGLAWDEAVATCQVQSPFDHARQGRLVVVQTRADPKEVEAYTREMLDALMLDLQQVRRGALVLFTSREQMRLAVDALSTAMRSQVLVQTAMPRALLLARHRDAVE